MARIEPRLRPEKTVPNRRYQLDWSRPLSAHLGGERAYHATNGERHILVVLTEQQIVAAERLCAMFRNEDPEITIQDIVELAISRAILRPFEGGELRLNDEDFE